MPTSPVVLIVDDQPGNLDVLVNYLADSGLELVVATDGGQALELAVSHLPELVLLDVMMPGIDGFETCRRLQDNPITAQVRVIFMSALADTDSKMQGFAAGAVDYLNKPLQREEVLARIQVHLTLRRQQHELQLKNQQLEALNRDLLEQIQRRQQVEDALHLADEKLSALTRQEAEHWGIDAFVGQSKATLDLLNEVRALQQAPRTNVLVLGESGTGKELISRATHFGSARSQKPFVAVNCSAIPSELADAEFFGHIKGAYTGATHDRHGYFLQADGGTLFLDEISDMPLAMQAKLLRVLEDGVVTPVGGRSSRQVDVRIVAATNADLVGRVNAKEFRQDLYFRLAGYQLLVPALRNRVSDIALLVNHYLVRLGGQMGRDRPTITPEAMAALNRYHYPGNVRELKNIIEYALIASRGGAIEVRHLHFLDAPESLAGHANVRGARPASLNSTPNHIAAEPSPGGIAEAESGGADHSDEEQILACIRTQGRIDNAAVQTLLGVNHGRASYLLKKLHKEGRLTKQGVRRWSYYTLPAPV